MAKQHSSRFVELVDASRSRVREWTVDEAKARLDSEQPVQFVDVREESEYAKEHLPGAVRLGKGVIERDIEKAFPDLDTELVLYCGGGSRSALAADALGRMGYRNVISMDGGMRGWKAADYPVEA